VLERKGCACQKKILAVEVPILSARLKAKSSLTGKETKQFVMLSMPQAEANQM